MRACVRQRAYRCSFETGGGSDDHQCAIVDKSRVFEQTFVVGEPPRDRPWRAGRRARLRVGGRMQPRRRPRRAGSGGRFDAHASGRPWRILGAGERRREGAAVRHIHRIARAGRARLAVAAGHAYRRLSRSSGWPGVRCEPRRALFASSFQRRAWRLPQAVRSSSIFVVPFVAFCWWVLP